MKTGKFTFNQKHTKIRISDFNVLNLTKLEIDDLYNQITSNISYSDDEVQCIIRLTLQQISFYLSEDVRFGVASFHKNGSFNKIIETSTIEEVKIHILNQTEFTNILCQDIDFLPSFKNDIDDINLYLNWKF